MDNKFLEKLADFRRAALALSLEWSRVDHTGDYFSAGYPFAKSFDEVCADIARWEEEQNS